MPIPVARESGLRRRLRKEEVFERMLEAILDGTLAPGERLRDTDLQEWLGVSRTPIRLAIVRLEQMRLIESSPNRFTRVSRSTPERIPQLLDVLSAIWALAAREAAVRMSASEHVELLGRLAVAASACRRADGGASSAAAIEATRVALFHLSRLSGNTLLADLVVAFGTSLGYQLTLQGARVDLVLLARLLTALEVALHGRDGEAAAEVLDRLRGCSLVRAEVAA
ncbi:putative HTH-type transcriptional regulator [Frondihabitans sp. 762G35]|uniref:GntR family transcriptional regulator n=1 Tax=Frondihabitans sp. 762G35 TaxID=1446794 RepID=UPI000D2127D0|nr:GntR family transcriptional regulator [Frondihabitans sp. 762G35]ARC55583.1 putative HTH-type transcriptional regulator [Frondihabitans sp. 762G35]